MSTIIRHHYSRYLSMVLGFCFLVALVYFSVYAFSYLFADNPHSYAFIATKYLLMISVPFWIMNLITEFSEKILIDDNYIEYTRGAVFPWNREKIKINWEHVILNPRKTGFYNWLFKTGTLQVSSKVNKEFFIQGDIGRFDKVLTILESKVNQSNFGYDTEAKISRAVSGSSRSSDL